MAARQDFDQFALILEYCSAEQGQRVAQKICEGMNDFRFVHDGQRFRIGARIGLVPIDDRWTSTGSLFHAADTVYYAVREAG